MITTFHADTGYHVNRFHGRTVSGQHFGNSHSEFWKKNSFGHHETIRISLIPKPPASGLTKSVFVKHALLLWLSQWREVSITWMKRWRGRWDWGRWQLAAETKLHQVRGTEVFVCLVFQSFYELRWRDFIMYRVEVYLCCSIHHHLQSQPREERIGS